MKFKEWIAFFEGVDLPIGDLAQEISTDPTFPDLDADENESSDELDKGMEYLEYRNACAQALSAFENAFIYYCVEQERLH